MTRFILVIDDLGIVKGTTQDMIDMGRAVDLGIPTVR